MTTNQEILVDIDTRFHVKDISRSEIRWLISQCYVLSRLAQATEKLLKEGGYLDG